MRRWLRTVLRWMYPGMRIKRWILLAFGGSALIVTGLMMLFGVEMVRNLYQAVPESPWLRYVWIGSALLVGIVGFAVGLFFLFRSVARGVAPASRERASDLIYRTRVLESAPHVVAIGGGTGLSTLLRGLKEETANLTAVVTVTDDGGSSGRLRREMETLPPGDVRNCILALAEDESRLSELFQHRFTEPEALAGHSLGNLVLVGLEQAAGGFDRAVEAMSQFLSVRGRVLPTTLADCQLVATMEDGEQIQGESTIVADARLIADLRLSPSHVPAYTAVIEAILNAELLILGPGSLYTSIIPNLLVDGVVDAISESKAEKLLIANLMTQPGETDHLSLRDHLRVLDRFMPVSRLDAILVNSAHPDASLLGGYLDEEAEPVVDDLGASNEYGVQILRADLVGTARWAGKETVKHSPRKLAKTIVDVTRAFSSTRRDLVTP